MSSDALRYDRLLSTEIAQELVKDRGCWRRELPAADVEALVGEGARQGYGAAVSDAKGVLSEILAECQDADSLLARTLRRAQAAIDRVAAMGPDQTHEAAMGQLRRAAGSHLHLVSLREG